MGTAAHAQQTLSAKGRAIIQLVAGLENGKGYEGVQSNWGQMPQIISDWSGNAPARPMARIRRNPKAFRAGYPVWALSPLHVAQKDIPGAIDRLDQARILGILFQLGAQARDADIHGAVEAFAGNAAKGFLHLGA